MWYLSCVLEHCTFVVNACALPEPLISRSSAIYLVLFLARIGTDASRSGVGAAKERPDSGVPV